MCEQQGVELVRRPTGGRAVYHRDEFTYSIIISKRHGVPSGIVAAYAYLAQGLQAALNRLGVHAELSDERVSKNPSAACFASSTQADLTSGGFKLIGSAQVWKDDALLQQGSLPLDDRAAEFFAMLRFPDVAAREEALAAYRQKTTPLHTFAPQAAWDDVARAFRWLQRRSAQRVCRGRIERVRMGAGSTPGRREVSQTGMAQGTRQFDRDDVKIQ